LIGFPGPAGDMCCRRISNQTNCPNTVFQRQTPQGPASFGGPQCRARFFPPSFCPFSFLFLPLFSPANRAQPCCAPTGVEKWSAPGQKSKPVIDKTRRLHVLAKSHRRATRKPPIERIHPFKSPRHSWVQIDLGKPLRFFFLPSAMSLANAHKTTRPMSINDVIVSVVARDQRLSIENVVTFFNK